MHTQPWHMYNADVSNLYSCTAAANPAAMSHVCVSSASQHITKCPCCYDLACLQNSAVKLPTDMVNTLLGDVMVCCTLCGQGIGAGDYDTHECSQFSKLQQPYG